MHRIGILGIGAAVLFSAGPWPASLVAAEGALTDEERKAGWVLLFDGESTRGWMSPKGTPLPASHVQDGALNPHPCDYMLVHERVWADFRLELDFKISPKCNSGIFVRTLPLEPRPGKDVGCNGIEIAIDDTTTAGFHDTGALYDLSRPKRNAMKPVGEWNHVAITCDRSTIDVELNGETVNHMDLDQWTRKNRRPDGAEHKFDVAYRDHPRRGYIGLQDHGADCWFKNIKLLPLHPAIATSLPQTREARGDEWVTAAGLPAEGTVDALMGEPQLEMRQVFRDERFPNVVVAVDGTVVATWGSSSVRARRSTDGGVTWGGEITIAKPGFQGGGLTVDEKSGHILAFVEDHHPPAPLRIYRSTDHGASWEKQETVIGKDSRGNVPSMHMNECGITLRHGKRRGRLLRPSRWYAGKNERARWPQHYTNAIYSDDGGRTWRTSDPFPALGTGEATVAELSDGRIYYNSRRHWAEAGADPRRRWTAWSDDGGATWKDLSFCEVLPDGPQDTNYGCMGGLVRLPVRGRDILVYSNCDSPGGRHHGTVWASFDGGATWPVKRLVFEGAFAYSSLAAGRPETSCEGWIFLHFEGGPQGGSTVARFNLSWLLAGEATGDGALPKWVEKHGSTGTSK